MILRKFVYPCEYKDEWENFNETLPKKKDFYSNLNMEGIKNSDYNQKEFVKILKQKN